MSIKLFLSAPAVTLLLVSAPAFAINFDEATMGDLSNLFTDPNEFTLDPGDNVFVAEQQGNDFGLDIDYFTVTVPEGATLTALTLDDYEAEVGNLAFLGIAEGDTFPFNFDAPDVSALLGGITYGSDNEGTDVLPAVATLGGAQGFAAPLDSGDYTVWLNQTGAPSTATFNFQVEATPEPPSEPSPEPTPDPVSVPEPGVAVALVLSAGGFWTLKRKS